MSRVAARSSRLCRCAGLGLLIPWVVAITWLVCEPEAVLRIGNMELRAEATGPASIWLVSSSPQVYAPSGLRPIGLALPGNVYLPPVRPKPRVWLPGVHLPDLRLACLPVFGLGYALLVISAALQRRHRQRGFSVVPAAARHNQPLPWAARVGSGTLLPPRSLARPRAQQRVVRYAAVIAL